MNLIEKYHDIVQLFLSESYMKSFGFIPLWIDETSAFVKMPLNPEHANFSGILWGGVTASLADVAAPIIAFTKIDMTRESLRLHTCETVLLKPVLFEEEDLLLFSEIAEEKIGTSRKGHPRKKITVITTVFSVKTGEEKALHSSLYDVIPKEVDKKLIGIERSKALG